MSKFRPPAIHTWATNWWICLKLNLVVQVQWSFWSLQHFFLDKPIFWLSHPLLKASPSSTPFPYVLTFLTKAWHQERRYPESQHQEDQWTYGCLSFSNSKWHVNQWCFLHRCSNSGWISHGFGFRHDGFQPWDLPVPWPTRGGGAVEMPCWL